MTFSVKAALDSYVATVGKVWEHDRLSTIGASEIGQCARRSFYSKNEAPHDEGYQDRWGAKLRGTIIEDHLAAPALWAAGAEWTGESQRTVSSGFLSATPDALMVEDGECFLVEIKTLDPRANLKEERAAHAYQVQVQMGLVREFTNYKPTHAVIAYIDCSFLDDVTEFRVEYNDVIYSAAVQRAREIMGAGDALELRPEGVIAGGAECEVCPFRRRCRGDAAAAHPKDKGALDEDSVKTLTRLVATYDGLQEDEEFAGRLLGSVKQEIKELLRSANIRWTEVDGQDGLTRKVNWQSRKGRLSLDQKAMERDGIDLSKYQVEGDPYDVLVIK